MQSSGARTRKRRARAAVVAATPGRAGSRAAMTVTAETRGAAVAAIRADAARRRATKDGDVVLRPSSHSGTTVMRAKHQPLRTCVACRQAKLKRELTRIVRTPEGQIIIDPTGKANGRGAYLCSDRACWERAIKRRVLNHALKTELNAESTQR